MLSTLQTLSELAHRLCEACGTSADDSFVKTKAMTDLLSERNRRKGDKVDRPPVDKKVVTAQPVPAEDGKDLGALVQSVKRKMGEGGKRVRKRSKK